MVSYAHKKLVEAITKLDVPPLDPDEFSAWIQAIGHLDFLRQNAREEELVVFASSKRKIGADAWFDRWDAERSRLC